VSSAVERDSLADQAYAAIRDRIVSLQLRPGTAINEKALVEELGIGRTPVREAVRRLSHEGLIEVYPRRGMVVTTVEIRDLASLCEVRGVLESHAARLAADRANATDREELAGLLDALTTQRGEDQRALIALDERIHRAIYRWAHNPFLQETLEEYYVHALRIWNLALDHAPGLEQAVRGHAPLLRAIWTGKTDRAADLMRRHVDEFERAMHKALLRA
jgi:DNA-binding GntR family transcriptional regulator